MNDFQGVRVRPKKEQSYNSTNDFQGVRVRPSNQEVSQGNLSGYFDGMQNPLDFLNDQQDLQRKSALQGIVSMADLPANLLHLAERGGRKALGFFREQAGKPNNIDQGAGNDFFSPENVDRPSKWLNDGVNYLGVDLTPRPKNAAEKIASHAVEFGAGAGPWGMVGKGAGLVNTAKLIKGGAATGAISGFAQEGLGVNPLVADLGSSFVNPKSLLNNFKKIPENISKIPLKVLGLTGDNFNLKAAQAARALDIDLPAAALTESKLTALLNQHLSKTPYFSGALKDKYKNADQQILEAMNKIYDDVGPLRTPDITKKISDTYDRSKGFLGENASTMPDNLVKNTKEINSRAVAQDADLKNLLNHKKSILEYYDPFSPSSKKPSPLLLNTPVDIKSIIPKTPVLDLIDQKVAFNDIIWGKGEQLSGKFKTGIDHMRKGAMADLKEYGKENPEWLKEFEKADKLHGSVEKRTKLEELLNRAAINDATGEIKHNSLAKYLHNKKVIEIAKQELSPEIFSKLEKLGKVSRAFAISNKNALNPSGTAFISTIINIAGGLVTGTLGLPYVAALGVAGATTSSLLTNKKFVDAALRYAEKPNLVTSMSLNKSIKEITGYTAISLNKALQKEQQEEMGDEE